ncbi:hypothetical protein KFL_001120040 [Klebsormidium nitens]|uniref:Disease resistance R13L4/SHOC-2-like LRR domain-containing protein n=1 Tax=Klebsormidium nitens TaxID=105231 RepID=A0A1Y1HV05_KLENI|nr:hypothetical protein KFL_001120040 [Klebsormidium nitens]|eukprot:GAQ82460.1 hypothetical protein KFL_001120040 [Klebsormidium nitens]
MLLTAALLLLYLSAACEAQGQGIDERPALVGRAKTAAGWKEELVLVRQDEWMQEGGGVLGEGRSRHEAGRAADLGVGFREASESGQELEQRARAKQGRPVSWREKEIGLVEKRNYDEQSLVVGDALSSRPDVHFLVEGSLQGVPGGEFEGPEGNGGVLSSMQLESGERFGHPVLGRNHTSKAFSRSRGEALAAVAGKFQDGTQEREASKSNARQPSVTTAGLDDSRVLQPRRHVLNAEQSTGWGASDDSVASTLWHLLPLTQGRSQWERGPAFSWSNPSKPALRLARRIHQRLQRARVLAEENAAGVPAENTLHRRYSKLEGFAPGPAPLPALGTSSPASNPGFAPNPAPASAPIPGPAAGPALAPAPASLPPAPSCPNITIPGLTPSPDRKTAYSDALALAAIKLVASNLTATKNWRGDDPCNNDWPRVLCEQQADGLLYVVQLDLSYMFLGGAIAPGICQLSKLRYLSLAGNNISGNLPASLGAMPRLQVLHLYDNNLTGPLPPELGWLSQLEELRAETNRLNGTVPASLGALQNLVLLSLSQNQLSGQIPPSLGRSQNLMIMRINNNGLIGSLPASLTDLINLQELDLSFNNLTGPIWPYLLGKLSRVQTLRLNNNNLTGPLDSTVGDMRALQTLELSNNKLQGTLPTRLSELHNLQYVSIRNNQLTGSIPKELGYNSNINYLMLSNNTLNGYLPDALGNILNLQELWLDGNQFSGPLPSGLGNLAQLKKMHLENNFFTGALPDNFNGLSYLQELWLDNNALSDPLNPLLAQCSSLSVLSMNNNSLTGSLPDEYGDISTLTYVSLANNSLMGPIPLTFGNPTGLRVIALQNNQLNGTIPPTLGKLTYLQQLWLQNNSLEGAIPAQLGNLKNVDLRLDGNLNICACVDALTLHFRFGTKLPFDSARKELLSLSLANGLGIQRQQVNLVGNVTYNGTNAYMTVNVLPLGNMSLTEGQIRAMVRGLKSRSVALPESMQDVTKYEVVGVEVPPDISLTDPKPSSAVIAGAAVGAVAALVLVLCTVSFFLHNRLKHAREKRASLEEGGSFDGSIESDDQETQRRRFSTFLLKCLAKAPCKNRGERCKRGGRSGRARWIIGSFGGRRAISGARG